MAQAVEVRPPAQTAPARDSYFDALRAVALLRVVIYHTVGAYWLHVAFPSIGVMFGLAGTLMARSMIRRGGIRRGTVSVVVSRLRRLLPPVWLYGIVAVILGWEAARAGESWWSRLPFWLLPLRDPHGTVDGSGFVDTLWYLRTYLWFVLLSPVMLWLFRRRPGLVVVLPLLLLPFVALAPGADWGGRGLITDLLAYGTCWLLGFAEAAGLLALVPAWSRLLAVAGAAGGLILQLVFPVGGAHHGGLNTIGFALWSTCIVFLLLKWRPDLSMVRQRFPRLDRLMTVVSARAVTIYLWHDPAIVASVALFGLLGLHWWSVAQLPLVLVFTAVAAFALGWVEDLAAKRRPAVRFATVAQRAAPLTVVPLMPNVMWTRGGSHRARSRRENLA